MTAPQLTIITPVYNAERFLTETLKSVQAQTFQDWEHLLVIDAKSSDRSLQIALAHAEKDPRIQVLQSPAARGAAKNRNLGLDQARGEFVAFLDADDTWSPEKSKLQIEQMQAKSWDFSFTAFSRMSEDGSNLSTAALMPTEVTYTDLLKHNAIASHTVILRRKRIGAHRFPDTVHEDFAFWLELLRHGGAAHGLNENLAQYRRVSGSRANNKLKAALWRWKILRDFEKISLPQSIYYFTVYAVKSLILHSKTRVP